MCNDHYYVGISYVQYNYIILSPLITDLYTR